MCCMHASLPTPLANHTHLSRARMYMNYLKDSDYLSWLEQENVENNKFAHQSQFLSSS